MSARNLAAAAASGMATIGLADKGITTAYYWNRMLPFQMPRTILVQIWQLGALHKVLQLGVLAYVIYGLRDKTSWAVVDFPANRVNKWTSDAGLASLLSSGAVTSAQFPYCENANYSFVHSYEYDYSDPVCQPKHSFEYSVKLPTVQYVPTVYSDVEEEGWPCAAAGAADLEAACLARGGVFTSVLTTQCVCATKSTVFPVGVEHLQLSFTHIFETPEATGMNLTGSSTVHRDDTDTAGLSPVDTTIAFQGLDEERRFISGENFGVITMNVSDWLKAAQVDLDQLNTNVAGDMRDPSHKPYLRTTGIVIKVDIDYSNIREKKTFPKSVSDVHAQIKVTADVKDWAGLGANEPVFDALPVGPAGAQTYKKMLRYSQGILFEFKGHGQVFTFDAFMLMNTLINAVVLLGVASTITVLVAKWGWPTRQMIRNKATEKFAIGTRLSEIGIKAIHYASSFDYLDKDGDGLLKTSDLLRALASTGHENLKPEQASAICNMIIARSNQLDDADDDEDLNGMDFAEFMMCMEAGQVMHFDAYKDMAATFCARKGYNKSADVVAETNEFYKAIEEKKEKCALQRHTLKAEPPTDRPAGSVLGQGTAKVHPASDGEPPV